MGKKLNLTNGVSFGGKYTVTSGDATATYVEFDFSSVNTTGKVPYDMVVTFTTLSAANAVLTNVGAVVTYPSPGTVRIANGAGYTLLAGWIINIVAQRSVAAI